MTEDIHVNVTNMNISNAQSSRPYRMNTRAAQAEATRNRILDAAKAAFETLDFTQIKLVEISRAAGVTEQTLIRKFGGKDGLFAALIEREMPRISEERALSANDSMSLENAIHRLILHYEKDGRAMLNYLAQEGRSEAIGALLKDARRLHQSWAETYCAACIGDRRTLAGQQRLTAAIAATDLYMWKLLRLDRKLSPEQTELTILRLLKGLQHTKEMD